MSGRLDGRRVLVTGAASGIGRACVLRLLDEGATVCGADVAEAGLKETAELAAAAGAGDRLSTEQLDVSDEAAVAATTAAVLTRSGGLDALVNAAGILRTGHTHEFGLDSWERIIAVNLTGTFLTTRAALPALLDARGVVVNFSSTSAAFGHPYMAAYAASKGGIDAFTHALAVEYAKQGLRAVALQPGSIDSGITRATAGDLPADVDWALFGRLMPLLGRGMADPGVVASVVAMLVSDDGRFITGTGIRIDGGTHA
ncbi:SDR family NAD(P)-dependent oxidoreductase [Pseudonocardia humida]|uniref:SDR family oxidoreductase n=1 Tax=Pseudonocardia humida TaxID=2800819 RepID=A0ABT0ZXR5_9PSEU|nr:SDR family NAD(P)-dependent oxidoreductase [Pseudonocardia humida]MCO1655516.1 SDR family oxidoreductase [Pseudonocardia humida]